MDHSYPYIASLTREPFLFYEMRSTAKLMAEGNSDDTIVKEIVEQNLFQYPMEKSITRMAKACIKRLHVLVMYPGEFDGRHVKLFNRLTPNDYYRAFNVIDQGR